MVFHHCRGNPFDDDDDSEDEEDALVPDHTHTHLPPTTNHPPTRTHPPPAPGPASRPRTRACWCDPAPVHAGVQVMGPVPQMMLIPDVTYAPGPLPRPLYIHRHICTHHHDAPRQDRLGTLPPELRGMTGRHPHSTTAFADRPLCAPPLPPRSR